MSGGCCSFPLVTCGLYFQCSASWSGSQALMCEVLIWFWSGVMKLWRIKFTIPGARGISWYLIIWYYEAFLTVERTIVSYELLQTPGSYWAGNFTAENHPTRQLLVVRQCIPSLYIPSVGRLHAHIDVWTFVQFDVEYSMWFVMYTLLRMEHSVKNHLIHSCVVISHVTGLTNQSCSSPHGKYSFCHHIDITCTSPMNIPREFLMMVQPSNYFCTCSIQKCG